MDRFLASLDHLRNTDPVAYAAAVQRFRDGLADNDDAIWAVRFGQQAASSS